VLLSAPTTPSALLAAMENGQGASRARVQPIMDALQQLSTAVYGRAGEADATMLNNTVDEALVAVRRLWTRSLIPLGPGRRASSMALSRGGSAASRLTDH
jgi:hypothetical protein